MTKAAKELFDVVYQWGRVGIVVDHTAPTYRDLLQKAAIELDMPSLNFYERVTVCAADQEPIADLEHAFESPDGKLYHNSDCAHQDEMITAALEGRL